MLENDADVDSMSPTWMSFADLMTGLLGAFVLLLLAWVDASAHTRSQSFSSWSVQGNELDGVYQVDAYQIEAPLRRQD